MKRISIILLFFILSLSAFGQAKKVVIEGDTLITITQNDLKKINSGIIELEYGKKLLEAKDSIILVDSMIIETKDSIIYNDLKRIALKDSIISQNKILLDINKEEIKRLKKKNTKGTVIGSTLGIILGVLVTLIATK